MDDNVSASDGRVFDGRAFGEWVRAHPYSLLGLYKQAFWRPWFKGTKILLGVILMVSPGHGAETELASTGERPWKVYTEWPFNAGEARRRQEETAKALGIPVEKSLELGNGVTLELVLIPAGNFIMGTLVASSRPYSDSEMRSTARGLAWRYMNSVLRSLRDVVCAQRASLRTCKKITASQQ